ncbi:MAG TPA: exodeoxyribonuclease VII small subunit [Clostridia bacterium]|nr:exodeoxyribonuclease VII small subunit [Clostridia bacterium]
MPKDNRNLTYEEASQRLEAIVQRLEQEELSLDEALDLFEEAVILANYCRKTLSAAEQRLSVLLEKEDGRLLLEPFSLSEE